MPTNCNHRIRYAVRSFVLVLEVVAGLVAQVPCTVQRRRDRVGGHQGRCRGVVEVGSDHDSALVCRELRGHQLRELLALAPIALVILRERATARVRVRALLGEGGGE